MAMIFILYKYTPKVLVLTNYVLNIFKTLKYHLIFANYRLIASLDKKSGASSQPGLTGTTDLLVPAEPGHRVPRARAEPGLTRRAGNQTTGPCIRPAWFKRMREPNRPLATRCRIVGLRGLSPLRGPHGIWALGTYGAHFSPVVVARPMYGCFFFAIDPCSMGESQLPTLQSMAGTSKKILRSTPYTYLLKKHTPYTRQADSSESRKEQPKNN